MTNDTHLARARPVERGWPESRASGHLRLQVELVLKRIPRQGFTKHILRWRESCRWGGGGCGWRKEVSHLEGYRCDSIPVSGGPTDRGKKYIYTATI